MGRIGKRQLEVPAGVEIKIGPDTISAKGPKGSLTYPAHPAVKVKIEGKKATTLIEADDQKTLALQGLYNSLLQNMIVGVTVGWEKDLELSGVGYRALLQGKKLQLQIGYSHPVEIDPPAGISFEVTANTKIKVKGVDRQLVGQIASLVRQVRKVEPYKGKGIKYAGEIVRRKAGKAAKAAGATGG